MLSSLPAAPPRRCTTLPVNTLIAANAPQLQTVVPVLKCTSGSVPFVIFGPYTQYHAQVPPPGWERALHPSAPSKCALPIFFRCAPALFPDVLLVAHAPWHAAASLGAHAAPKSRPAQNAPSVFFFSVRSRAIPGHGWCSPRPRSSDLAARVAASARCDAMRPASADALIAHSTRRARSLACGGVGGSARCTQISPPLKIRPPIFFLGALSPDARGAPASAELRSCRARFLACGGVAGSVRCTQVPPPSKCALHFFFSARSRAIPGRGWCSPRPRTFCSPRSLPGMRRRRGERALHPNLAPPQNTPSNFFLARYPRTRVVLPHPRSSDLAVRASWHAAAPLGVRAAPKSRPPSKSALHFFFSVRSRTIPGRGWCSPRLRTFCSPRVLPGMRWRRGSALHPSPAPSNNAARFFFSSHAPYRDAGDALRVCGPSHPLGHLSSFYGDDQDAGDKGSNAGTPTTPHHPGFPYFFPQPHFLLDSLALSRISLALSEIFILWLTSWTSTRLFPLSSVLFQPPNGANDAQPPMSQASVHELKKAKFLVDRASCPYANEGPGVCYNVACAADDDIKRYRAGKLTGAQFLARLKWKVGHSGDWERRQREYAKCDVKQTHIWICRWEVNERYYCERLAQLEQFCNGGERIIERCPCGVRHREYFTFSSIGGFADFSALMMEVVAFVDESEFPTKTTRGRDCGPTKAACGWVPVPTNASSKVDKGDVQVVSNDDKGDVQVVSNGDKGDVRVVLHSDKEAGHRSRSVLRCGAWDRGTARRCVTPAVWGRTAGRALV
ncbi:hypothetical protein B0H19DRAFT_1273903 [Mycena capillaripes]|nr:hypothetical protein B0H19DRAFT_1273903 [Mycena capillaripes]